MSYVYSTIIIEHLEEIARPCLMIIIMLVCICKYNIVT
jgi:hypothetical protein